MFIIYLSHSHTYFQFCNQFECTFRVSSGLAAIDTENIPNINFKISEPRPRNEIENVIRCYRSHEYDLMTKNEMAKKCNRKIYC